MVFSRSAKALIRSFFQQRRKQMGALMRGRLPDDGRRWLEQLSAAGLSNKSRPESIPVPLWIQFSESLSA
jgi:16S rRNA (adenine1518-N6/adenine1519-N6)-dimethyltransferase